MKEPKANSIKDVFMLPNHRRANLWEKASDTFVNKVGDWTIVRKTPEKSFTMFQLAEISARKSRESGRPIDDLTKRWIEIPSWTDDQERQEIQNFLRPNNDPWAVRRLGTRLKLLGSPQAASALSWMAEECLDQLQEAADSVRETELTSAHASIAAEELTRVILNACHKMNALAKAHPRIFQRFSRKGYWKWPVMKSPYPEFGDDEKSLLAGLQLGKDLPLRLDSKAQWARRIEDDAGKIAWHLLWYVWRTRSENNKLGFDYGEFRKMADALPLFDKSSALKWWKVAKAILLHSYPKPLDVEELAALVKGRKARRYPSRLEDALFEKLKNRFISFAKRPFTRPGALD